MKKYLLYKSTGEIVSMGACDDIAFEKQLPLNSGLSLIEINEYVIQDSFVENSIVVAMPPKPNGCYVFNYATKQWDQDFDKQTNEIKNQRDQLLSQSDWTQIPNNPLTIAKQQEWASYRQQLRDIPSQSGYPFNVIWPVQPQ